MKYKIGDAVYYVESSCNYKKSIPCQMCFGKRKVTIIKGDGTSIESECGACERGIERATGYMTVWEPEALVKSGVISGISTKDGLKYEVGYGNFRESELYLFEAEAEEVRLLKLEEEKERAALWFQNNFIQCTKKQIWSASYHAKRIESAERDISWHKARLCMIDERRTTSEKDG